MSNAQIGRLHWIDVLKGIGIFLVVLGHIGMGNSLQRWIYSFHMPMFFMLSGMLWAGRRGLSCNFMDFLKKRTISLLIPYVLFRLLLFVYWLCIESHFRALDLGPIWFLIVLYADELIVFLLSRKFRNAVVSYVVLFIISSAVLYVCDVFHFSSNNAFSAWFTRIADGMMWYLAGCVCSLFKERLLRKHNTILILAALNSVAVSQINAEVSMWSNVFGFIPLYILGGLSGTAFLMCLCKEVIKGNRLTEWYGRNTVIILATHEPIKRVVLKCIEWTCCKIGICVSVENLQKNIWSALLVVVIVFAMEVLVIRVFRLIKNECPFAGKKILSFVH